MEVDELRRQDDEKRRKNLKLSTQLTALGKEHAAEITNVQDYEKKMIYFQRKRIEKQLRDVEARIESISKCVYNARKLEHAVLALLAHINAHGITAP